MKKESPYANISQYAVEAIVNKICKNWGKFYKKKNLTCLQFSEKYIKLPAVSTADAGEFIPIPYQKAWLDSIHEGKEKIVFKKSARVGYTKCLDCIILYFVSEDPSNVLVVYPTDNDAREFSEDELGATIKESPEINDLIINSLNSKDNIKQKSFPGCKIYFASAKTTAGLRRRTARVVCLDEVSAYPQSSNNEGDPLLLAEKRTLTFGNRKRLIYGSTPGTNNNCKISELYELSDQRRYYVPCPTCKHYQYLKFKNLKFRDIRDPAFICEKCKKYIEEYNKSWMVDEGEWRATAESDIIGFHIWSAYNPFEKWSSIVREHLDAGKDPEKLKIFVTHTLGEEYKNTLDVPLWEDIYKQRMNYEIGTIPTMEPIVLIASVDVQKDRLEVEVFAFGKNNKQWSIEKYIIWGSIYKDIAWERLKQILSNTYSGLYISLMLIDSGYETQRVYNFCSLYPNGNVIPIKGRAGMGIPAIRKGSNVDVRLIHKTIRRACTLWLIGVDTIKNEIFDLLKQDIKNKDDKEYERTFHFPEYDEDYFKQLTSEYLAKDVDSKGFIIQSFKKVHSDRANEVLDLWVYARAGRIFQNIHKYTESDWNKIKLVRKKVLENEKIDKG